MRRELVPTEVRQWKAGPRYSPTPELKQMSVEKDKVIGMNNRSRAMIRRWARIKKIQGNREKKLNKAKSHMIQDSLTRAESILSMVEGWFSRDPSEKRWKEHQRNVDRGAGRDYRDVTKGSWQRSKETGGSSDYSGGYTPPEYKSSRMSPLGPDRPVNLPDQLTRSEIIKKSKELYKVLKRSFPTMEISPNQGSGTVTLMARNVTTTPGWAGRIFIVVDERGPKIREVPSRQLYDLITKICRQVFSRSHTPPSNPGDTNYDWRNKQSVGSSTTTSNPAKDLRAFSKELKDTLRDQVQISKDGSMVKTASGLFIKLVNIRGEWAIELVELPPPFSASQEGAIKAVGMLAKKHGYRFKCSDRNPNVQRRCKELYQRLMR